MNKKLSSEVREAVDLALAIGRTPHRRAAFRFLRSWLAAGESLSYACDRLRRHSIKQGDVLVTNLMMTPSDQLFGPDGLFEKVGRQPAKIRTEQFPETARVTLARASYFAASAAMQISDELRWPFLRPELKYIRADLDAALKVLAETEKLLPLEE